MSYSLTFNQRLSIKGPPSRNQKMWVDTGLNIQRRTDRGRDKHRLVGSGRPFGWSTTTAKWGRTDGCTHMEKRARGKCSYQELVLNKLKDPLWEFKLYFGRCAIWGLTRVNIELQCTHMDKHKHMHEHMQRAQITWIAGEGTCNYTARYFDGYQFE